MSKPQPGTDVLEQQLHQELVRASDDAPPAGFGVNDVLAAGLRRRRLRKAWNTTGYAAAVAAVGVAIVLVPNDHWFSEGTASLASPAVQTTPEASNRPDGLGQSVQDQHADLAASLNISDPPEVDVVRLVTPEERAALVQTCEAEHGYTADVLAEVGIPAELTDAYNLVQYVCMAEYPVDPTLTREWSEVQISIQYDWTINNVIPCLAEHGYSTTDVPNREDFIATYYTATFYPFAQISDPLSNEETEALNQACPQTAPSALLWPKAD